MPGPRTGNKESTKRVRGRRPEADGVRSQFLRACEAILLKEGIGMVSTRRVAADASASISLIPYHFGGLDGLVSEVLQRNLDVMIDAQKTYGQLADPKDLRSVVDAFLRPMWSPAAFHPKARAALVVQEIYRRSPAKLRAKADGRLEEGFMPLVRAMASHLGHIGQAELIWRVCAIAGTVVGMADDSPSWRLFRAVSAHERIKEDAGGIGHMIDYALAVLAAPASMPPDRPATRT